jgi:hypothetical protein
MVDVVVRDAGLGKGRGAGDAEGASTGDLRRHFDGPVAILPHALAAGLSTGFPASCNPMERGRDRKFADSPLEGSGFELLVPRR